MSAIGKLCSKRFDTLTDRELDFIKAEQQHAWSVERSRLEWVDAEKTLDAAERRGASWVMLDSLREQCDRAWMDYMSGVESSDS